MRMVKCPQYDGKGFYDVETEYMKDTVIYPVRCTCDNGKISWSEYLTTKRKKSKKGA